MEFSRSPEGKEENPQKYNGLRARERKNTSHITLNQRQLLSFGTVYDKLFLFLQHRASHPSAPDVEIKLEKHI